MLWLMETDAVDGVRRGRGGGVGNEFGSLVNLPKQESVRGPERRHDVPKFANAALIAQRDASGLAAPHRALRRLRQFGEGQRRQVQQMAGDARFTVGAPVCCRVSQARKLRRASDQGQRQSGKARVFYLRLAAHKEAIVAGHDADIHTAQLPQAAEIGMRLCLSEQTDLPLLQVVLRPLLLRMVNRLQVMTLVSGKIV